MNIAPWKRRIAGANGALTHFRDEMDRAIERFLGEPFAALEIARPGEWFPALDVSETDSELTVRAELPGVSAEDLEISVTDHTLTITGSKQEEKEEKGESFYQCERRFGAFRRDIELPQTADAEKVSAEIDNGVVTIHVAKKPGAKPRQVEVKPAGKREVPVKS